MALPKGVTLEQYVWELKKLEEFSELKPKVLQLVEFRDEVYEFTNNPENLCSDEQKQYMIQNALKNLNVAVKKACKLRNEIEIIQGARHLSAISC